MRHNPVFSLQQYSFTGSLFLMNFICHTTPMYLVTTHEVSYETLGMITAQGFCQDIYGYDLFLHT